MFAEIDASTTRDDLGVDKTEALRGKALGG